MYNIVNNIYRYATQRDGAVVCFGTCGLYNSKNHHDIWEQSWEAELHFYITTERQTILPW